jgi:hypothetical protein
MSRRHAFEQITRIPIATPAEHFPDQIKLPGALFDLSQKAIEGTMVDGRERWVHGFSIARRWVSDGIHKGGSFKVGPYGGVLATTGDRDMLRAVTTAPHVHMHTHPALLPEVAERSLQKKVFFGDLRQKDVPPLKRRMLAAFEVTEPLPSSGDIHTYLHHSAGSVANVIGSAEGIFVCVKSDPRVPHAGPMPSVRVGARGALFDRRDDAANAAAETAFMAIEADTSWQADEFPTRSRLLSMTASLLSPDYVTYFTPDASSPVLDRVPPGHLQK